MLWKIVIFGIMGVVKSLLLYSLVAVLLRGWDYLMLVLS